MPTKKKIVPFSGRKIGKPKTGARWANEKLQRVTKEQRNAIGKIPTRYQLAMVEKVLATGNHFQTAARAAGIDWKQWETWRDLAIKGDPHYRPFLEAIDRGETEAEILAVSIVMECAKGSTIEREMLTKTDARDKHGKPRRKGWHQKEITRQKDWRAAAWLLEHRFADRFAAMRKLQHSGALTHRTMIVVHGDKDPTLDLTEWQEKKEHDGALGEASDPQADLDRASGGDEPTG